MPAAWRAPRRRVRRRGARRRRARGVSDRRAVGAVQPNVGRAPALAARTRRSEAAEAHYDGTGLALGIDLEPSLHGPVREAATRSGLTMVESRPGMTLDLSQRETVSPPDGARGVPRGRPGVARRGRGGRCLPRSAATPTSRGGSCPTPCWRIPRSGCTRPASTVGLVSVGESTTARGRDRRVRDRHRSGVPAARASVPRSPPTCSRTGRARPISRCSTHPISGYGVYERLGFRSTSTWEVWVREAPAA